MAAWHAAYLLFRETENTALAVGLLEGMVVTNEEFKMVFPVLLPLIREAFMSAEFIKFRGE